MTDQKNLVLAIALSIAIVLGFEFFYNMPRQQERAALQQQQQQQTTSQTVAPVQPGAPVVTPGIATPAAPPVAAPVVQPRVRIETPQVEGSILLAGGILDDLTLSKYRQTVEAGSPPIRLLSAAGTENPYFAENGWVTGTAGVPMPDATTLWTADRQVLTPAQPVTLTWDNGQGLRFERRFEIEGEYLFRITQRVTNSGAAPVQLFPYSRTARTGTPHTAGFYILHEGPVGITGNRLQEPSYDDVKKEKAIEHETTGGWVGITDKYWLVAVIPDQAKPVKAHFTHTQVAGQDRYQADFLGAAETLAPGASTENVSRIFAGAKEVRLLDAYTDKLGIQRFDYAIDWGWFAFLTKPIFKALDFFYHQIGNFGLAILLLTVVIKLLFFPLANKSYRAMSKMKLLQPEMEKLRAKYGDDRQRLSQEMMGLYKKVGANPMAGCLPILIQIPVFFALYKVLFVTIEMRHAPFYGWIKDLSAPDPTSLFNLFGLIPWTPPDLLHIGLWPLIMGLTMFLQQKINPQPPDPVQAKIFLMMPVIFTVMLASFPAGLVIYWAWNNVLSVLQQWVIMKRTELKPAK
jgi:YidC/Oxa1 family membrane protein insertase